MPGTSAASAPSLHLSHFLFAHLPRFHRSTVFEPSTRYARLWRTSSSSRKISPGLVLFPCLGNKTDCNRSGALQLTTENVAIFVFLFSLSLPRAVYVIAMSRRKKKKIRALHHAVEFCCLCKLDSAITVKKAFSS